MTFIHHVFCSSWEDLLSWDPLIFLVVFLSFVLTFYGTVWLLGHYLLAAQLPWFSSLIQAFVLLVDTRSSEDSNKYFILYTSIYGGRLLELTVKALSQSMPTLAPVLLLATSDDVCHTDLPQEVFLATFFLLFFLGFLLIYVSSKHLRVLCSLKQMHTVITQAL